MPERNGCCMRCMSHALSCTCLVDRPHVTLVPSCHATKTALFVLRCQSAGLSCDTYSPFTWGLVCLRLCTCMYACRRRWLLCRQLSYGVPFLVCVCVCMWVCARGRVRACACVCVRACVRRGKLWVLTIIHICFLHTPSLFLSLSLSVAHTQCGGGGG